MTRRRWAWLRMVAGVGILVALGWRLGTEAFLDGLRAITFPALLAALGIGLLTTVSSAWRWCVVAQGLGLPLTLRAAVPDYYRGLLLNAVLPAGVLGDVHRAVSHGRQSGDVGRGVRAVVFERFAGQVVLIAIGLVVLLTQPVAIDFLPGRGTTLGVAAVVVAVAVVAARSDKVRRALAKTWLDARDGLLSRHALPRVALLSAATVVGHIALFVVAARTAGSSASLGALVPLIVLALLVMAVPVNVGGFGPREAFLAVAFGAAGLGAAQGLTTAVVYGVLAMVAALPGVLVLFRRSEHREVLPERPGQRREQVPALVG
ncbi:lysylphosphatidylglycerol synthase transmembrane domain-containing protein [Actinosynnema sp. CS-041913]|uniref:lysylphosphatidylglycerol synthase transmembrane domain-containing protein n=1 Tax=Actinosynnema sp. CS-041913 TaxID=3239917 RepID=UPI003D8AB8AA